MRKIILFLLITTTSSFASSKTDIIQNIRNINNLTFNFEQNINGKIERGICTIEYPKKIFCKYDLSNNKIMVSNGKSLVIKTTSSYYLYPLDKTPLNFILDKNYLLEKIENLNERILNKNYINYKFIEQNNEINIFFDKKTYNLIGWQTLDMYQNLIITYLSSIKKNRKISEQLFKLPSQN